MSRSFRSSEDDLAYGDSPQRWDRDRFERAGNHRAPSRHEEDFRFEERDRSGRRDTTVVERIEESGPSGRFEERDRFWERERTDSRPRRRTDRELFGDVDPRELAGLSLTKYERTSSRPGLLRRQSSLDSFIRRPTRFEREELRLPPLPLPRERYRDPEDYREVEITRERSVRRDGPPRSPTRSRGRTEGSRGDARSEHRSVKSKKSRRTTRASSTSSSSSSSNDSVSILSKKESIRENIVDIKRKFKRGTTRMPKRLVRREAIMDLAYPFDEDDHFFVLRVALQKEQIDEVLRVSETYKSSGVEERTVIKIEDTAPDPPQREQVTRTEWINPPSHHGHSRRSRSARPPSPPSPSFYSVSTRDLSPPRTLRVDRSRTRSRAPSASATLFEERKTVVETKPDFPGLPPPNFFEDRHDRHAIIEERPGPLFPGHTIIEERPGPLFPGHVHHHGGELIIKDREIRSDRDIQAEIRALEFERQALRMERGADERREGGVRIIGPPDPDYPIVTMREARPVLVANFEGSPPREDILINRRRSSRSKSRRRGVPIASITFN